MSQSQMYLLEHSKIFNKVLCFLMISCNNLLRTDARIRVLHLSGDLLFALAPMEKSCDFKAIYYFVISGLLGVLVTCITNWHLM